MAFNPGSFTSTGNVGIKPTIVASSKGYLDAAGPAGDPTLGTTIGPQPTALTSSTTVNEGKFAVAKFDFKNSAVGTNFVELRDTATINVSYDGTSAADVAGPIWYRVYSAATPTATDGVTTAGAATGWVQLGTGQSSFYGATVTSTVNGQITFTDSNVSDPMLGTGIVGVELAVFVKTDALVESGEHVLFKVTQSDATKFTDSFYVEQKVDIVDTINNQTAVNTTTPAPSNTPTTSADTFSIAANSNVGLIFPTFATINAGFGVGDKLKVDMATGNQLSMVNFGNLASVGVTTETGLLNGLLALDKELCNVGGLYIMEVSGSTYIIFDSNGSGSLDTSTASAGVGGSKDVFVELVGVTAASIQSTHFDLY